VVAVSLAIASFSPSLAFFASTSSTVSIFFFARNPCVLPQVVQPGRL